MSNKSFLGAGDPGFLDNLYRQFLDDPHAVPRDVARAFAALAETGISLDICRASLAEAWRREGHLVATLDPLADAPSKHPANLNPARYGLEEHEGAAFEQVYGRNIGWEFSHLHDPERRYWIAAAAEGEDMIDEAAQKGILSLLTCARHFEDTLSRRLPGVKTFGLAGSESFLVALEGLLKESVSLGIDEAVVGGMHRGRLTQLALIFNKPLTALITEVMGAPAVPAETGMASDVPYHLGWSCGRDIGGRSIALSVLPHPSHLSVVTPVALGKTRGEQALHGTTGAEKILPLMLHTDAAFSGQGIIAETFQLSRLPAFSVGGTVHVVLNNQIGFTTIAKEGRSSRYCTDVAKATETPVIHVNGDDPEAVLRAARIAARYRARFQADIVLEIIAYRRRGHNEIDEPRFTQPEMYDAIDAHQSIDEIYQTLTGLDCEPVASRFRQRLDAAFEAAPNWQPTAIDAFGHAWSGLRFGREDEMTGFIKTGIAPVRLKELGRDLTSLPQDLSLSVKVTRFMEARRQTIDTGQAINWATAEALALASLATEGQAVRLGGQDAARGPFTQRHLMLHDQKTGSEHNVLARIPGIKGPRPEVFNTPLTEYAVVAFEYGLSLADPNRLILWEAQFGDFFNIAQAVFDQFIVCGEDRWMRSSGLAILLPHGLDGGGPDHSSAHPERLLAACAKGNIQVINPSTPANYFHALRRQMARDFRKPLIVLSPKILLRHRDCVSNLSDMESGTGFHCVLPEATTKNARRVILCSGKIFYELAAARQEMGLADTVALVRIEQLYPFPAEDLRHALNAHPKADVVWVQEEPANMGVFNWLDRRLEAVAGRPVRLVSRPDAASPGVGVKDWHEAEKAAVINAAFNLD